MKRLLAAFLLLLATSASASAFCTTTGTYTFCTDGAIYEQSGNITSTIMPPVTNKQHDDSRTGYQRKSESVTCIGDDDFVVCTDGSTAFRDGDTIIYERGDE